MKLNVHYRIDIDSEASAALVYTLLGNITPSIIADILGNDDPFSEEVGKIFTSFQIKFLGLRRWGGSIELYTQDEVTVFASLIGGVTMKDYKRLLTYFNVDFTFDTYENHELRQTVQPVYERLRSRSISGEFVMPSVSVVFTDNFGYHVKVEPR